MNKIAGEHGIGVVDIVENRLVGMKSRGIYETPGGTLLHFAIKELESICLDKETQAFKKNMGQKYGELVYNGLWYSSLKDGMDAFIDVVSKVVTGTIKLKLYKGNIKVAGRISPNALYDEGISSFGASDLYDHHDAEGFIKIFSLPSKIKAMKG